jgi:hypothetical protein
MPDSVRARSQAGLRMGQFVALAVTTMTLTIVAATHSKLTLSAAQERLFATAGDAEQVFATEARAAELRHELQSIQGFTQLYERLAFPLEVSAVLTTIVQSLPECVTLDQLDLDAGARVISRSSRSRGAERIDETPPRVLTGELSGFAPDDQSVTEIVSRLEATPPFEHVSLDFSRGRIVNERDAREFRLSFRINLENRYDVTYADESLGEEVANAEQ